MILIQAPSCTYSTPSRLDGGQKAHIRVGGGPLRFYNGQHRYYCGIDRDAKSLYVCIRDAAGTVLVHRNVKATPAALLEILALDRDGLVVAAERMITWYWLADLCARENIPFVLGHALAMKALHGGKAKNDKIDSHKIAVLLRGGLLP